MSMMAPRILRVLWWFMLLPCFVPMVGNGNDAQGNYVVLGFGGETCQAFLQARSNSLDMAYRHWVTGYLTAVNKLTTNTVDIRGTTDTDGMHHGVEHIGLSVKTDNASAIACYTTLGFEKILEHGAYMLEWQW